MDEKMNDNFDFSNGPQNEVTMSDSEKKTHKKIFSKIAFNKGNTSTSLL